MVKPRMAFALQEHWVWDFWFADDGRRFHLYYLFAPKALGDPDLRHRNARIGHATSDDLTTWEDHGRAFDAGDSGAFDETATWTGSVVQGPDGIWRMFYTGSRFLSPASNANIETIGVATSRDLFRWEKQRGPVCRADGRWYETFGTSDWPEEAWRDPWVFAGPDGTWHMLVTARSKDGPLWDRGVVGHATSADLVQWEVQPPLSAPGIGFAHLEVPQTVTVAGAGYLLFSCDTPKLSGSRRGGTGGIWSVAAPVPTGPFAIDAARLLVPERLYAGRIVRDRAGQPVLLAFDMAGADGNFIGALSDPIPVRPGAGGTLELAVEQYA